MRKNEGKSGKIAVPESPYIHYYRPELPLMSAFKLFVDTYLKFVCVWRAEPLLPSGTGAF